MFRPARVFAIIFADFQGNNPRFIQKDKSLVLGIYIHMVC